MTHEYRVLNYILSLKTSLRCEFEYMWRESFSPELPQHSGLKNEFLVRDILGCIRFDGGSFGVWRWRLRSEFRAEQYAPQLSGSGE